MNAFKLMLKLPLENPSALSDHQIVPVFHSWIQTRAMDDHLVIDVADYAHVHNGPGTVLVTHEANVYLDHGGGQVGLLYQRKQPIAGAGTFAENLAAVFRHTLAAARRVEEDASLAGRVRFLTSDIRLRVADRRAAPNTAETLAAIKPALVQFLDRLLGPGVYQLERDPDQRHLFEVRISSSTGQTAGDLLSRLEAPMAQRA